MIRHPPEYVPSEMRRGRRDDPQRQRVTGFDVPARQQGQEDDTHRLLRVLQAVPERHRGGRHGLGEPETTFDLGRCLAAKVQMIASIKAKPSAKATNGDNTIGMRTLSTTVAQLTRTPASDGRADQATDQGV